MKKTIISALAGISLIFSGCGSDDDFLFTGTDGGVTPAASELTQVEFLARPGIAEALLFDNSLLATYNAVGPNFVANALADPASPEGQAAGPVLSQASTVLDILTGLDPANGVTTAQAVGAFLPDVMRIDTSLNVPVDQSAYAFSLNAVGSPVAGRKLTDDVVDITLTVLTGGVLTSDGVPYYRPAGETNEAIGHSFLNGQTVEFGPAEFPFLAPTL